MALTAPIGIYGLWSLTLQHKVSKLPLCIMKVAAEFTMPFMADMEDYFGGGSKFILGSEPKYIKADAAFSIKQFNKEAYQYLADGTVSAGSAEPAGAISALTNMQGTSVFNVSTGLAAPTLTAGDTANLKAGDYIVQATSATAVQIYAVSDVDFSGVFTGGTPEQYQDDSLKILATPMTITTGCTTAVTSFGVTMNGGSGTIAFTVGDTALFTVMPANIANETVVLGKDTTFFPAYSATAYSVPKAETGELIKIYMPNVQVSGLDLQLKEYAWVSASPKLKVLRSTSENMVASISRIQRMPY